MCENVVISFFWYFCRWTTLTRCCKRSFLNMLTSSSTRPTTTSRRWANALLLRPCPNWRSKWPADQRINLWAVLQNRNGHWLTQTLMSSHASWGTYSQVFHCHVLEIFQVFPFCLHFGETIAFVYRGRVAECRGLPVGCALPQLRKQKLSTQTCKNAAGNGIYEKAWWIRNVQ